VGGGQPSGASQLSRHVAPSCQQYAAPGLLHKDLLLTESWIMLSLCDQRNESIFLGGPIFLPSFLTRKVQFKTFLLVCWRFSARVLTGELNTSWQTSGYHSAIGY